MASGNRETRTALGLLILPQCRSPMLLPRAGLVGNVRPAQDVTVSSSVHCSAKRGGMSLHACLSSIHRPLLVSAGSSLISFLTIAFEQGKEHAYHRCLPIHVQLHQAFHKPSSTGLPVSPDHLLSLPHCAKPLQPTNHILLCPRPGR